MNMEKLIFSSAELAELIEITINKGGAMPLLVTGNSMRPFIRDGKHTVWLEACKDSDFKRGKILFFRRADGRFVLHRVRKVLSDGELVMNGDAQYWCENIKKEQAVAVVTYIEAKGKKISCNSLRYKIKIEIWQLLKPVRPYIFMANRKIKKLIGYTEQ